MTSSNARPLPDLRDAGRTYWLSAGRSELLLPTCDACRRIFWPPRPQCPLCGSSQVDWTRSHGTGAIHTFTVVRQTADAYFRDLVPYVVAMVELDDGPRIMTNVVGVGALDVTIGMRVKVQFEAHGEIGIPVFAVDRDASAAR